MILPLKLDLNQVVLSPKKGLHDPQSLPALSARMSSPGIARRGHSAVDRLRACREAVESLVGGDGFEPPTSCV
jgi:hypothetical protein